MCVGTPALSLGGRWDEARLSLSLSVCLKERKSKLEVSSDISTKTPSKEKPKLDITQRISHRFRKNMYFEVMCYK